MFIEEDNLQVLIEYHFKACAKVDLVLTPSTKVGQNIARCILTLNDH